MYPTPLRHILALASLAGGVFCLDRLTKNTFFSREPSHIIPGILETTQHHNQGLLANLAVPMPLIILLTSGICLGLIWIFIQKSKPSWLFTCAIACLLGGALGNLFDRITQGFVFDWILLWSRSIINIADISIGIGIFLWIFHEAHLQKLDRSNENRQL